MSPVDIKIDEGNPAVWPLSHKTNHPVKIHKQTRIQRK